MPGVNLSPDADVLIKYLYESLQIGREDTPSSIRQALGWAHARFDRAYRELAEHGFATQQPKATARA